MSRPHLVIAGLVALGLVLSVSTFAFEWNRQYPVDVGYVGQGFNNQATNQIKLAPGQTGSVYLDLKNTGTQDWSSGGANPLRIGADRPQDRSSKLATSQWLAANRPGSFAYRHDRGANGSITLTPATVIKPGETARFVFPVQVPNGYHGQEYFQPVQEGKFWLGRNYGIYFQADSVAAPQATPTPSPKVTLTPTASPKPSPTPSPSLKPSPTPTVKPVVSPSPTPKVSPSPSLKPSPSPTPTPLPTDTQGPTVSLTSPTQSIVSGPVALAATTTDPSGVSTVNFYVDGKLVDSDTSAPYTATWDSAGVLPGQHSVTAQATDARGNSSSATTIVTTEIALGATIGFNRIAIASEPDFSNLGVNSQSDRFVVVQSWRTDALAKLKAANPNTKVLAYYNLTGMTYPVNGDFSGCVNPTGVPERYFLHTLSGQRFTFWDHEYIWAANQGDSGYQQECANRVVSDLKSKGFDGAMLDDTNGTIRHHYTPSEVKEYPTDAQYGAATKSAVSVVGPKIQAAGKLAIPNMGGTYAESADFNDSLWPYVSGGLDEFFVTWPGGTVQPDYLRARAMQGILKAESMGKYYLANTTGSNASDVRAARYGLASVMLVSDRYATFGFQGGDYSSNLWLPEFGVAKSLGAPVGSYYSNGAVQRRDYQNGLVLANPTNATQAVSLGGSYSGSGLQRVSNVSMPPQTGLILQRAQ